MTGPALEPVSLAEARDHLRLDTTDEDALLLGLISAARTHVENVTGRALITQTWRLDIDEWLEAVWTRQAWGIGNAVRLGKAPVQAVTSVQHIAGDGTSTAIGTAAYRLIMADVAPMLAPLSGAGGWPTAAGDGDTLRITFTAGYGSLPSAVPAPIRHAIMLMTAHLHANREAVSPQAMATVPLAFEALLSTYRTVLA